jgi:hypothetical protein
MNDSRDDFYVGYLPVPRRTKRFAVGIVGLLIVVAATVGIVIASQQKSPGTGQWEFGQESTIEGLLTIEPYPLLTTDEGTYLLVAVGKMGVRDRVADRAGEVVKLTGTKLQRQGRLMFELAADDQAVTALAGRDATAPPIESVGPANLQGEIIDPKCYLGAMKPGGGKTHKACAVLCVRGGIPPMFVTRHTDGSETFYLLTDAAGEPILEDIVPYVGDPVELEGRVMRRGDLLMLRLNVESIQRL